MKQIIIALLATFSITGTAKELLLGEGNILTINDEINQATAEGLEKALLVREVQGVESVVILLDSPGGSVVDGMTIADILSSVKVKTQCVVRGEAASMAAVILQYCTERYATDSSIIMFHDASGTFNGSLPQVISRAGFVLRLTEKMDKHVADRVGLSYDELMARQAREWWLVGAEEAKKANVIDDVVVLRLTPPDPNSISIQGLDGATDALQQLLQQLQAPEKEEKTKPKNRLPNHVETIQTLK